MDHFQLPQILDDAIEQLVAELPLKDRGFTANLNGNHLALVRLTLEAYVGDELSFSTANLGRFRSCRITSRDPH